MLLINIPPSPSCSTPCFIPAFPTDRYNFARLLTMIMETESRRELPPLLSKNRQLTLGPIQRFANRAAARFNGAVNFE